MTKRWAAAAAALGALIMTTAATARAADIAVFATPSLKPLVVALTPQFESKSGHKLVVTYATSAVLKRAIDAGDAFDAALLVPASIDDLIKQGKIAANTRIDVARSAIGVAVKAGTPKPDVGTTEGFKRAMVAVKSVSFSGEGASGKYLTGLFDRLGIGDEMKPKLRPLPGAAVVEPVAKGEIDIAVITIANIVGVAGVELVGKIPEELQHYTVYTAGVATGAKQPDGAKALIQLLMSPETTKLLQAKGMERLAP